MQASLDKLYAGIGFRFSNMSVSLGLEQNSQFEDVSLGSGK